MRRHNPLPKRYYKVQFNYLQPGSYRSLSDNSGYPSAEYQLPYRRNSATIIVRDDP